MARRRRHSKRKGYGKKRKSRRIKNYYSSRGGVRL